MLLELALATSVVVAAGAAYARFQCVRLYSRLTDQLAHIRCDNTATIDVSGDALPRFDNRLAMIPNLLNAVTLEAIRAEAERLVSAERSYVPTHKQGGTVAYETLIETSPTIVALYHAPALLALISRLCGAPSRPTPINDQSSLSLLFYTKPSDHIGWHYDHNFIVAGTSPCFCHW